MMKAREIIATFVIAILLPLLALLSVFFLKEPKGNSTVQQTNNLFPSIAPTKLISSSAQEQKTAPKNSAQAVAIAPPATSEKPTSALSLAADAVKHTTESWQDFLARFRPSPASLPAGSPFGDLFVGGIATPDPFPLRNWQVPLKDIDGWAVVSTSLPENKILYEKDIFTPHPIASISKLMTALVASQNLALDEEVVVDEKSVATEGDEGGLIVGETLTVKQLLYAMLLTSSNDAAVALAQDFDLHRTKKSDTFVAMMNKKAQDMKWESMAFQDPTGLSPQNVSSANDVAQMMFAAYQDETLRPILSTSQYDTESIAVQGKNGIKHHWVSTDSLLGQVPGVVAGKTGFINEAGQCIVVVSSVGTTESPKTVVSVVLGSSNRMQAMATLLSWIQSAYSWQQ